MFLRVVRRRPQAVYVHAQHGAALPIRRRRRISGPIMDRIDIHLDVRRVPFEKLASLEGGEPSKVIRARVEAARKVQEARFADLGKTNMLVNGDMGPAEVQEFCAIDAAGKELMRTAVRQLELSARAYHRVLEAGAHPSEPLRTWPARRRSGPSIWPRRCSTGRGAGCRGPVPPTDSLRASLTAPAICNASQSLPSLGRRAVGGEELGRGPVSLMGGEEDAVDFGYVAVDLFLAG